MFIIAASRIIDGVGNLNETDSVREKIRLKRLRVKEVKLASIKAGWGKPLPSGYVQGAPSPLQAIQQVKPSFDQGQLDVLIISGEEQFKSDFAGKKEERDKLMLVYENETFLTAFNKLTRAFCKQMEISRETFHMLCQKLFENYHRTWKGTCPNGKMPEPKWFEPVNDFFRGVDCANPYVDFSGCLIVMTEEAADRCEIPQGKRIRILACNVEKGCDDGVEQIPKIVSYDHIEKSFRKTCEEAGIDFRNQFLKGDALLEVYTCYPVVPIAFLLKTKFVQDLSEIPAFLKKHPITITGGLNLGKAPWNNPTLNHLIAMTEKLRNSKNPKVGGLHSNGALGYLQGFAILKRP